MKKTLILFFLCTSFGASAQLYYGFDVGLGFNTLKGRFDNPEKTLRCGKVAFMGNIHLGYITQYFFVEYNQSVYTAQENPLYLGLRAGPNIHMGEFQFLPSIGGYYRLLDVDHPKQNFFMAGYGLKVLYKKYSIEVSKKEFFEISVGIHRLFREDY